MRRVLTAALLTLLVAAVVLLAVAGAHCLLDPDMRARIHYGP